MPSTEQTTLPEQPEDPGKANLSKLAKMAETKHGYFRTAFALVDVGAGKYVAVRLEKVTAESAYPADTSGPFKDVLLVESRPLAADRLGRAIEARSREAGGFSSTGSTK